MSDTEALAADDADLAALCRARGVVLEWEDADQLLQHLPARRARAVLAAMGVDASSGDGVRAALDEAREREWAVLPPVVVVRAEDPAPVPAAVPSDVDVRAAVVLGDDARQRAGERVDLPPPGPPGEASVRDGRSVHRVPLRLPAGLPLGRHHLEVDAGDEHAAAALLVCPTRAPQPLVDQDGQARRGWGWSVQLHATRSSASEGLGDLVDLRDLVHRACREQGADAVLVNPLHASAPVLPRERSPYSPTSRRFRDPLHLRVAEVPEARAADDDLRARVDEALEPARAVVGPGGGEDRLDRDLAWRCKEQALRVLWDAGLPGERRQRLSGWRGEQGDALERFALWCALAQRHGPDWTTWPDGLRDPDGPDVAAAAEELADEVAFWCWCQLLVDEQLRGCASVAAGAGARVGVLHDLAVGVDGHGADAWALQGVLALGATVGAPPDPLGPQGQDWGLPPWDPRALVDAAYEPYVDLVRAVLRHAGGLRVDHVLGLSRLWWVPAGSPSSDGAYVRYDLEATLGVLALEAHRAGALVVGEDLGTVEPAVRRAMAERGVLGTAVLWFEADDEGTWLPPRQWREQALATVSTHDLPTARGWLRDEQVRAREAAGVAGDEPDREAARADAREQRERLLRRLVDEGLADASDVDAALAAGQFSAPPPDVERRLVVALHAALVAAPSRLVLAQLADAVGDVRMHNLPGTSDEHPNWSLPLARREGDDDVVVLLDDEVWQDPQVTGVVDVLRRIDAG